MNKRAQLTPAMEANKWKPGCPSPNPTGRPKRKPITEAYEAIINDPLPSVLRRFRIGRSEIELPKGATFADLIALGQAVAAAKGNTAAAQEIANRLEGKVPNPVEGSGPEGGPIMISEILTAARERLRTWTKGDKTEVCSGGAAIATRTDDL